MNLASMVTIHRCAGLLLCVLLTGCWNWHSVTDRWDASRDCGPGRSCFTDGSSSDVSPDVVTSDVINVDTGVGVDVIAERDAATDLVNVPDAADAHVTDVTDVTDATDVTVVTDVTDVADVLQDAPAVDSGDPCVCGPGQDCCGAARTCVNLASDVNHCGACGTVCAAAPVNGFPVCVAARCEFDCDAGYAPSGGACARIGTPRLLRPLHAAFASSRTPALHFALDGPGAVTLTGAEVVVCADRLCAMGTPRTTTVTIAGARGFAVPDAMLAPGVHFWRARGLVGTRVGSRWSAAWEVVIGAQPTHGDTSALVPNMDFYGDGVAADGLADVFISNPAARSVTVFRGTARAAAITTGATTGDFGASMALIGDTGIITGVDGFSDLAVGDPMNGSVHLFPGRRTPADRVAPAPDVITLTDSGAARPGFGTSVAAAGDVDADQRADLLVSDGIGNVWLYRFVDSGTVVPVATEIRTAGSRVTFGSCLGSAGDVDGDGFSDLIVGDADRNDVTVFFGSAGGIDSLTAPVEITPMGVPATAQYGTRCAAAGDVNGDGYADIAIWDSRVQAVIVYAGGLSRTFVTSWASPMRIATSTTPVSIATAGDQTAPGAMVPDGRDEIVVGVENGEVSVFALGPGDVWTERSLMRPSGTIAFGFPVLPAGDVDGNGTIDLLIGDRRAMRASEYLGRSAASVELGGLGTEGALAIAPRTARFPQLGRAPVRVRAGLRLCMARHR